MNNSIISLVELENRTFIDRDLLKEVFKEYNLQPILLKKDSKFYYDKVRAEKIVGKISENYEYNKRHRMSRHEFIESGGHKDHLIKLSKYRLNKIDRIFEFKGCRYIYDRVEAENFLSLDFQNKEKELVNLKTAANLLSMTSFKAGKELIKTSAIKQVPSIDQNNIFYYKKDILKLKKQVQKKALENKEKYYTIYNLRDFGLTNNEIQMLKSIPLQPIEKVEQFKNCSVVYLKKEVDPVVEKRKLISNDLILKNQFYKDLGFLSTHKVDKLLIEMNVEPVLSDTFKYYKKEDIDNIKSLIQEKYQFNKKNYYTAKQALQHGLTTHDLSNINSYKLKTIEKVYEFHSLLVIYSKLDVEKKIEQKEVDYLNCYSLKDMKNIFPFEANLKRILQVYDIKPIYKQTIRGELWKNTEVDSLFDDIKEKIQWLENEYFSLNEAKNILSISLQSMDSKFIKHNVVADYLEIPEGLRIGKFRIIKNLVSKQSVYNLKTKLEYHEEYQYEQRKIVEEQIKNEKEVQNNLKRKILEEKSKAKEATFKTSVLNADNNDFFDYIIKHTSLDINIILTNVKNYSPSSISDFFIIAKKDVPAYFSIAYNTAKHIYEPLKCFRYNKKIFFLKKDVQLSIEEFHEKQKNFLENYCTSTDFLNLGGTSHEISKLQQYEVEHKYRTGKFQNTKYVYLKSDCEKYFSVKKYESILNEYKFRLNTDLRVDILFTQCLIDLGISFSPDLEITKEAWIKFSHKKLLSSKGSIKSLIRKFSKFIKITEVLTKLITENITEMSNSKINKILSDTEILISHRIEIYIWLNVVYKEYKVSFNFNKLKNVHELFKNNKKDKSNRNVSYTEDEFLALIDYVSDTELHKRRAIEEFESKQTTRKKYRAYESVWLYVMLHLNNGWRSQSFIETIPRISLPPHINTIKDFKNNTICIEEAQKIVWELTSNLVNIQHSKNDKKNYFFCSDKLLYPLANALILCELKSRANNNTTNQLIFLTKDNELSETLNRDFFSAFVFADFKFKSLKANHTVITFSSIIFNQLFRESLDVAKLIRNHNSINTTNTYVDIDDNVLNQITKELFNTNYFGYTYAVFKNNMMNKNNFISDGYTHFDSIKDLKNIFGDVYKVENLAVQMNFINQNYQSLFSYLESLDSNEIKGLDNLIRLQQLPAKESHYQCLLGDCLYENQKNSSCSNCPFAVPHFYALTKITKDTLALVKKLKNLENVRLMGEKVHIVNLFYKNLILISSAKKKFGEGVISSFLGGEYSQLLKEIDSLEDIYPYLTIAGRGTDIE